MSRERSRGSGANSLRPTMAMLAHSRGKLRCSDGPRGNNRARDRKMCSV